MTIDAAVVGVFTNNRSMDVEHTVLILKEKTKNQLNISEDINIINFKPN